MIASLPGFGQRITARRSHGSGGIIVDLFAGAGGASLGIEAALGRAVNVAVNHDRLAVEAHEINHPATRHLRCDVWEVDPVEVCGGRPVDLLWASPDCRHFSKAKGGRPVSRRVRSLAWVVVRWARDVKPAVIMLENVEEFSTWGPLGDDDRPCPRRRGQTFKRWVGQLRRLGYDVEWRELVAAYFGAPTTRRRLFLIARRDGRRIVWPEPTHAPRDLAEASGLRPWRAAAECIDWSIDCPSIFGRSRPLADATMRRIAKGLRRYVIEASEPFIVRTGHWSHRTGEGFGFRGQSTREPLATVCTTNDKALVAPFVAAIDQRRGGDGPSWGVDRPLTTIVRENRHALVCAFLAKHYGGVVGHDLHRPIGTVTAKDHHSVVAGSIEKLYGTACGADDRAPMPTVTGQGNNLAALHAFLTTYYGNEKEGQSLLDPMRTVTSKDRFGLVTVAGELYKLVDIGLRMLQPRELLRAQFGRFADEYVLMGTKSQQVRAIGNSVCPEVAEQVIASNLTQRSRTKADVCQGGAA